MWFRGFAWLNMVCDFGGRFDFWDDSDGFFFLREKKRKTGLSGLAEPVHG